MTNLCMMDIYLQIHSNFIAEHFKERERKLRKIIEFWQVTKRAVYGLLLTASFLIFYLLSKLNEALSMLY